jgi:hypothetical protein
MLREVEDLKWSARLAAVSTDSAPVNGGTSDRRLSAAAAVRLVRDYVEHVDRSFQDRYRCDSPESAELKRKMQIEEGRQIETAAPCGEASIWTSVLLVAARQLLNELGSEAVPSTTAVGRSRSGGTSRQSPASPKRARV